MIGLGSEWRPDPDRPGYFFDPRRPGWLRDATGHWFSAETIDALRREVDAVAPLDASFDSAVERVRRAAREVLGGD